MRNSILHASVCVRSRKKPSVALKDRNHGCLKPIWASNFSGPVYILETNIAAAAGSIQVQRSSLLWGTGCSSGLFLSAGASGVPLGFFVVLVAGLFLPDVCTDTFAVSVAAVMRMLSADSCPASEGAGGVVWLFICFPAYMIARMNKRIIIMAVSPCFSRCVIVCGGMIAEVQLCVTKGQSGIRQIFPLIGCLP